MGKARFLVMASSFGEMKLGLVYRESRWRALTGPTSLSMLAGGKAMRLCCRWALPMRGMVAAPQPMAMEVGERLGWWSFVAAPSGPRVEPEYLSWEPVAGLAEVTPLGSGIWPTTHWNSRPAIPGALWKPGCGESVG